MTSEAFHRLLSPIRSAFTKAASHPQVQAITNHAAKISAGLFAAANTSLLASNYLQNGSITINVPPTNPDEWLSFSGLVFFAATGALAAGDKFNGAKKAAGTLMCGGAFAMAAPAPEIGNAMYVAAAAPMLTGLSLAFEDQANRAAESLRSLKNVVATAGRAYLNYPIATMAGIQAISATSAFIQGMTNPAQRTMLAYGFLCLIGNGVFALADNNVRAAIRSVAQAKPDQALPEAKL